MKPAVLALCTALLAPYQCATKKEHQPLEDTAPQALWSLSERFAKEGDAKARETTLRQIVDEYPSSRYAQRARDELGIPAPEGSGGEAEKGHEATAAGEEKVGFDE
jgi:hypothetical protein